MAVSSSRHNSGEIIVSMVGGITEVTSYHHSRMIKQRPPFFFDHFERTKECIKMPDNVVLNPAELLESVRAASMMRKSMPAPSRPRHTDGSVDPIERYCDHPCRICLKRQFRQLEQVSDLGGEGELMVNTQGVGYLGLLRLKPELLVLELHLQLLDDSTVRFYL